MRVLIGLLLMLVPAGLTASISQHNESLQLICAGVDYELQRFNKSFKCTRKGYSLLVNSDGKTIGYQPNLEFEVIAPSDFYLSFDYDAISGETISVAISVNGVLSPPVELLVP